MGHVLFFAGNADTQLKSYLPVMKVLRARGDMTLSLFFSGGFPTADRSDVRTNDVLTATQAIVDRFVPYGGRGERGKLHLWDRCELGHAFQRAVARSLRSLKPDLVVVPNNKNFRNRATTKLAAFMGIPTLVLQDGTVPGGLRSRLRCFAFRHRVTHLAKTTLNALMNSIGMVSVVGPASLWKFTLGHGSVTKLAVWGQSSRDIACLHGYREDQIVLVGQPRFDEIVRRDWSDESARVYASLELTTNIRRILFLPTKGIGGSFVMTTEEQVEIYRQLASAVTKIAAPGGQRVAVVVKLHRDENLQALRSVIPEHVLHQMTVVQDVPLYPLLHGCDVAVTAVSTAGLEALLFGKALITINLTGRPDYYDYATSGAAVAVRRAPELYDALVSALRDAHANEAAPRRDTFLQNELFGIDGCAAERAAALVHSLVTG